MVAIAFLRLVTNSRVFTEPDSIEDAIAFIDVLLDTPGIELEDCGKEWPMLHDKLLTHGLNGNLVTDARGLLRQSKPSVNTWLPLTRTSGG